jgi:cell cycle checkpoint protein
MAPASGSINKQSKDPVSTPIYEDTRPWAQRFGPVGLDELAVHKRKVSDVQKWLDDVFEGRRKEVSQSHGNAESQGNSEGIG